MLALKNHLSNNCNQLNIMRHSSYYGFIFCLLIAPCLAFANVKPKLDFVQHPFKTNLFNKSMNSGNDSSVGLLVTPLAPQAGQPAPVTLKSVLNDNGSLENAGFQNPMQVLDNVFNTSIIKQLSVGVQMHF